MSSAYIEASNQSNDNGSNDGSDSMGLNDLYALNARKESNGFLDYINPMDDGQISCRFLQEMKIDLQKFIHNTQVNQSKNKIHDKNSLFF